MTNNTADLKKFAQRARRDLREQVAGRLEQVLRTDSAELREREAALRELREEIAQTSKKALVDKVAYTWFNRFCALRFMDVNHYTRMGVVSPAEGLTQPEILQEAKGGYIDEALTNFVDAQQVYGLLNGQRPSADPQQEAYRLLLVAVCNSYNAAMPFMFEKIADYTELLMPLDLLSEHSILHELREALTPEACQDVEVIGWLYQYYISERKDEVFEALKQNQKIEAADIPAATQLFTPHWIVRYLVENSLGRLWMLNHPESRLRERMEYYIESAEGSGQRAELPTAYCPLPTDIKLADPACGSGHILTYAFDLLYAIYEESGYTAADIPSLILQRNLYGIEIDARAGALAAFALTMKARAKDRRFLTRDVQPNICVLKNVTFTPQELDEYSRAIGRDLFSAPLLETLKQFEQAENFGALIRPTLADAAFARGLLESRGVGGDLFLYEIHQRVLKVLQYAEFLAPRYHVVVANPPYMGSKGMNESLKNFLSISYSDVKSNLFTAFIVRNFELTIPQGYLGFLTPFVWMYLSSHEKLRDLMLSEKTIYSLVKPSYTFFFESAIVALVAFVLKNSLDNISGKYIDLGYLGSADSQPLKLIEAIKDTNSTMSFIASANDFKKIPGYPIAYWLSDRVRELFSKGNPIGNVAAPRKGNTTTDNNRFLRAWSEISTTKAAIGYETWERVIEEQKKWVPYNKGGGFRKWYGFNEFLVNWENRGKEIRETPGSVIANETFFFKPGLTWSTITSSNFSIRKFGVGFIFDNGGCCVFGNAQTLTLLLGFMNTKVFTKLYSEINPTLNFQSGDVAKVPFIEPQNDSSENLVESLVKLGLQDWDAYETSWGFAKSTLLQAPFRHSSLAKSYTMLKANWQAQTLEMQQLEQENNRIFIEAYGLQDELTPEVPLNEITLTCNPRYRYGGNRSDEELESMLRADTIKEFISYAVGCMFGRYSLEKPGLVLANAGEGLEDYWRIVGSKQKAEGSEEQEEQKAEGSRQMAELPAARRLLPTPFTPDEDNVIPVLEGEWFSDDITERFKKFLRVTFGDEHYAENLAFIEEAIGRDVRSYFMKEFYKEHIQMYKKRPIYWMFSSAKGSFNVLIYMHRYQPDTISVILNRYLREFRAKLEARKAYLEQVSISGAATPREKVAAEKEIQKWTAALEEIRVYERDVLYPLATQKLTIDLDDGVKVNYAKFGSALAKIPGL